MSNINLEIPAEVRDFAEKTVDQARKAFEGFIEAAQKATAQAESTAVNLQSGAKDVSARAIGYAEENVRAAFDLAQKLISVKNPQEILSVQSEFLKSQLATVQAQAKELGEAVKKVVTPTK